jgi:hypothetical protein
MAPAFMQGVSTRSSRWSVCLHWSTRLEQGRAGTELEPPKWLGTYAPLPRTRAMGQLQLLPLRAARPPHNSWKAVGARAVGQLQQQQLLLLLLRVRVSDHLLLVGLGGTCSSWGVAWVPGDLQECVVTQDGRRLWCRGTGQLWFMLSAGGCVPLSPSRAQHRTAGHEHCVGVDGLCRAGSCKA